MGRKTYEELDFTDDFLFCKIMMNNEDLCIELVELITGRKIRTILHPQDQKAIRLTRDGKGVRLDVYFEDTDNVVYDIEMQAEKKKNLPKRIRYYQGMIDLNILAKGGKYADLKESYVIFICTFDEFEKGRHVYSFENLCKEDPSIRLEDGAHKIILCARGTMDDCSEKMKDFLAYVAGEETNGELSDRLREEVKRSKSEEKWRAEYMLYLDRLREEYDEGFEAGEAAGKAKGEAEREKLFAEREKLSVEREKLSDENKSLTNEVMQLKAELEKYKSKVVQV